MNKHRMLSLALITSLTAAVVSRWKRIRVETRHWPSGWNIIAALFGSIVAGLIFLQALDLLDDFIALF